MITYIFVPVYPQSGPHTSQYILSIKKVPLETKQVEAVKNLRSGKVTFYEVMVMRMYKPEDKVKAKTEKHE